MKKILIILLTVPFLSFGNQADLFELDNQKVDSYMKNLEIVEDLVVKNEADYSSTLQLNPSIYDNVNLSSHSNFSLVYGPPLGIPSFAWGLCCGLPGLAVVYFIADDKEETKKAFYGCVTSTVVGVVVNVAVLGAGGEIFY